LSPAKKSQDILFVGSRKSCKVAHVCQRMGRGKNKNHGTHEHMKFQLDIKGEKEPRKTDQSKPCHEMAANGDQDEKGIEIQTFCASTRHDNAVAKDGLCFFILIVLDAFFGKGGNIAGKIQSEP
jgi:hypothetical protein